MPGWLAGWPADLASLRPTFTADKSFLILRLATCLSVCLSDGSTLLPRIGVHEENREAIRPKVKKGIPYTLYSFLIHTD